MQQCQEVLKIGIHCRRHIQCCAQRQICSRPGAAASPHAACPRFDQLCI